MLLLGVVLPLLVGCAPHTLSSTVHFEQVNADQYLVQIEVARDRLLLSSPSLLCAAGEEARMQLAEEGFMLDVAVWSQSPAPGEAASVDVTVTLTEQGRRPLTQRLWVPVGTSGTVTCETN